MLRYLSIGALMLSSAAAMAEGPSYSYIQASYEEVDIDRRGDGDGFRVSGSVAIGDSWFVFAGYASSKIDRSFNLDQLTLGGGWHSAMSEKTDWFASLAYIDLEASGGGVGSDSDSGFGARLGIRSMLNPNLELYGSLGYSDQSDVGDGASIRGGAWYTVTGNLALGLGLDVGEDVTRYGVGIRLYFDK